MKLEEIAHEYGCAASTAREVLLRLACDGFLDSEEQKGFRVPNESREMLMELAQLRMLLEQEGARNSIANGDIEWEASLTAAHHKLAHIEERLRSAEEKRPHIAFWCETELHFHETLIAACGSELLQSVHRNIFHRYRQHLVAESHHFGFRVGNIIEHQDILDAVLARDPDACCEKIRIHIQNSISSRPEDWQDIPETET